MTLAVKSDETRRKIIEAAGQIFAEVGYEAATVRQITESAGVNVSSINYHFGDKGQLYREVLTFGLAELHEKLDRNCSSGTAEERLLAYIRVFTHDKKHESRPWQQVIITREMFEKTRTSLVPDLVVELIRPSHNLLIAILQELLGPEVGTEDVHMAGQIVIGILIHWVHGKEIAQRLSPPLTYSDEQMDRFAELAFEFVLGGISNLKYKTQPVLAHEGTS